MIIRIVFIIALGLMVPSSFFIRLLLRSRRRKYLMTQPISAQWADILNRNVFLYAKLPDELKTQLHGFIQVFLSEKRFEGCDGLEITDEIKLTIAAEACMLLLNRTPYFYPRLSTILVYPHAYSAKKIERISSWTHTEEESVRAGESWDRGEVVLAWDHVQQGARTSKFGHNVVLHEFAHQLDQEDGASDGVPILEKYSSYAAWASVMQKEYDHLLHDVKLHRKTILDYYGATNRAEFFAVATEAFFEKPELMRQKEPDLYNELKLYYKLDPAEWQ